MGWEMRAIMSDVGGRGALILSQYIHCYEKDSFTDSAAVISAAFSLG